MGATDLGVLPLKLSDSIRESFKREHRTTFWARQFVRAGLGPEEAILAALERLVNNGELVLVGDLRCSNGHSLRRVEATALPYPLDIAPECLECPRGEDDREHPTLRVWFEVSPSLSEALGGAKKAAG
jgi:hypothetical protein